jgi:Domain of unknown function (DUF4351)
MTAVIEDQQERESIRRQSRYFLGFVRDILARGKARGRADLLTRLLALRFGQLTETIERRIRYAKDEQVNAVAERMLTAKTLEEALLPLA